jgi:hypothetical protein
MTLQLSRSLPAARAPADAPPASGRSLEDLLQSRDLIRRQLDELRRSRDPDPESLTDT